MAKILVSMPDRLVARIDAEARRLGLSRSAYLSRLTERELVARSDRGREARVRRAIDKLRRLVDENGAFGDSTQLIREERDAR